MSTGQLSMVKSLIDSSGPGGYELPKELAAAWNTYSTLKGLTLEPRAVVYFEQLAEDLLAQAVAGKPADVKNAAVELQRAIAEAELHRQQALILAKATELAVDRAVGVVFGAVDDIIEHCLAPALADVFDQARGCAKLLAGRGVEPAVLLDAQVPQEVRDAYQRLGALADRRSIIWSAYDRINRLAGREPEHDVNGEFIHFETPANLPGWSGSGLWPGLDRLAPEPPADRMLWFVSPEVAAAKPWMPTFEQRDAAWLRVHGEALEQQRAAAALAHHVAGRAPMFLG